MLHVITGPPCAGKSTYMREHARDGDVLVDYDAIAQAVGRKEPHVARREHGDQSVAALAAWLELVRWARSRADAVDSWVIHAKPLPEDMDLYERAGAEVIELGTDMQTCLERAERDGRPPGTEDAIREWFEKDTTAPKGASPIPEKGGRMELKTKTVEVEPADATTEKPDNGTIAGYASTWTREPDCYGDVVAKGAFAGSIARIESEGRTLPLLWNHDSDDLKSYIGTVTRLEEDDHGLLFEATFDDTPEAQRARQLALDGRLAKFSFAYEVMDQMEVELGDGRKANELRELEIHEVSLVMYPANPDTSVVDVKGADQGHAVGDVYINVVPRLDEGSLGDIAERMAKTIEGSTRMKFGRRNSKADEDALRGILALLDECRDAVAAIIGADEREDDTPDEGDQTDAYDQGDATEGGEGDATPKGREVERAKVEAYKQAILNQKEGNHA